MRRSPVPRRSVLSICRKSLPPLFDIFSRLFCVFLVVSHFSPNSPLKRSSGIPTTVPELLFLCLILIHQFKISFRLIETFCRKIANEFEIIWGESLLYGCAVSNSLFRVKKYPGVTCDLLLVIHTFFSGQTVGGRSPAPAVRSAAGAR